jgi:hypothetical protein
MRNRSTEIDLFLVHVGYGLIDAALFLICRLWRGGEAEGESLHNGNRLFDPARPEPLSSLPPQDRAYPYSFDVMVFRL